MGANRAGRLSRSTSMVEHMFSNGGLARKSHEAVARVAQATNPAVARHVWRVLHRELLDLERAQYGDHGLSLDRLEPRSQDGQLGVGNDGRSDGHPAQVA